MSLNMVKKVLLLCFLSLSVQQLQAQQFGLFNTKTLFDSFENPAQKSFTLDSSRKFASNFFLPYFGINGANEGNPEFIRRVINEDVYNTSNLPLGTGQINTLYQNSNVYLLTLKIFQSYKHQQELGFAWQLRTDGNVKYTNETLAILDSYTRFLADGSEYDDAFNTKGYAQSYHQFSMTYRENYNKRLSFGAKISLLSGTSYNRLKITDSYLQVSSQLNQLNARLSGVYKGSFLNTDELSTKTFMPTFKNPGLSFGFGTSYTSKSGLFLMANIKDLGFIRWSKSSYINNFGGTVTIDNLIGTPSSVVEDRITDLATDDAVNKGFFSPTNAKIDAMASRTFGFYSPSLIVSKNLFYRGGDIAFVNKFRYEGFSLSATPAYNLNNFFMVGMQGMYQTPNFEVFLGSDDLFKTSSQLNGFLKNDATIGKGYNGASVYIGVGIKFGNTVEHPQNSSYMPGLEPERPGFFKRIFSVFSKKR